jgi:two-component system KDP operon response regulator KdpE
MSEPVVNIVLIEDDKQIRRFVRTSLEAEGMVVHEAETGRQGLVDAATRRPDLVIVDLGLPDVDGLDVIRDLRGFAEVPVVVLSARSQESEKVAALDAGADDYLTKPFNGRELLARLRVMLRHVQPEDGVSIVRFGAIEIDFSRRTVTKHGEAVSLTAKEYDLLRLFVSHRGKVLTHRQILRDVWGPNAEERNHYLRVYMDRLRRKLEENPKRPKIFETVLGVGYRFEAE